MSIFTHTNFAKFVLCSFRVMDAVNWEFHWYQMWAHHSVANKNFTSVAELGVIFLSAHEGQPLCLSRLMFIFFW